VRRWLIVAGFLALFVVGCQRETIADREKTLREDLFTLRSTIDQYTFDKQRAPLSLDDLIRAGYLKELPLDPMTRSRTTWHPVRCEELMSIDQNPEPGICDVHSGSDGTGSDGTAYNTW